MPRLDNSDTTVTEYYELEFDPNDPGATEPIDICDICYNQWRKHNLGLCVDHPNYNEVSYSCLECENPLTEQDN